MYERYVKRVLDVICSLLAMILLSPVILITGLLVRTKLGSPVLFKQERPGRDEKIFTMYKFRTMTDGRDGEGNLLPDDIRLTKFGKLLRSTSLDELPELWNIFKGDMSIVGPRPLLVEYLPHFTEEEKHRHDVRPGLTGLAQVSGRNAISWEQKLSLDIEYRDHISFLVDLRLVLTTIHKVVARKGISSASAVTMEKFQGSLQGRNSNG
ncbi:MAG: sugar transferase [Anaerovoracaceae bacterium]